jgi:hypothetical protein
MGGGDLDTSVGSDKVVVVQFSGGQGGKSDPSCLDSYCPEDSGSALVQGLDFQLDTPEFHFLCQFP